MKIVETSVTPNGVRMLLADGVDAASAKEWVELQVPLERLDLRSGTKLDQPELQLLAEVQVAALRYARGVADDEARRLATLIDRSR
jgi:hypothetical protein